MRDKFLARGLLTGAVGVYRVRQHPGAPVESHSWAWSGSDLTDRVYPNASIPVTGFAAVADSEESARCRVAAMRREWAAVGSQVKRLQHGA